MKLFKRSKLRRKEKRTTVQLPECAYCGNFMTGRKRKFCNAECRTKDIALRRRKGEVRKREWNPTERQALAITAYLGGMTLREAGESVGVTYQAVAYYLQKAGIQARPTGIPKGPPNTCIDCQTEITRGHKRCQKCHGLSLRIEDKRQALQQMWHEGKSMKEIAAELGYKSPATLNQMMHRMRKQGYDLPKRGYGGRYKS